MSYDFYQLEFNIKDVLASLGVKVQPASLSHRNTHIQFVFELLSSPKISRERLTKAETMLIEETGQHVRIRKTEDSIIAEIPNPYPPVFSFGDVKEKLRKQRCILPLALGKNDYGRSIIADLWKMPHILIGGSGEAGQKNLLDLMVISISEVRTSKEAKFILVDIDGTDFDKYSESPYLLEDGLVKDYDSLFDTLDWLDSEVYNRYCILMLAHCRNITEYNKKARKKLPYLIFIVKDIVSIQRKRKNDFERYINKIAAKARAAGIHLVLASSAVSAGIITGTIKNNMPAKIAFHMDSALQSRIIIDNTEAMYLGTQDDFLFSHPSHEKMQRGLSYKIEE